LLNAAASRRLREAGVDRHVRGRDKPSDHAPAWVVID
jgi:exodeoxyribonuclease-3